MMLGQIVPLWLTILVGGSYGLSIPYAGWLVVEAGRMRREERRRAVARGRS